MWFKFDPSQKCSCFSLLMSYSANAISLCVIKVSTDDIGGWLSTKWKAWMSKDKAVSRSGLFQFALHVTTFIIFTYYNTGHWISLSYFYKASLELRAQQALVCTSISPTVVLMALLIQAIFWVSKKLWGRVCGWWLHPELLTIHHSPFSVNRRPVAERRPTRDPFREHICQMTACSVYHPLWLRQIHCHREPLTLA